jgi:hypothetical protein
MGRRVLAITTFIWAMIALSQLSLAQVIVNGTVTYPPVNGSTVMLGNGPTTPIMTYAAPGPTAGISNAGRAGISNSAPLPSTLAVSSDTVVYYTQPGIQPMITLPGAIEGVPPVAVMPTAATEAAPAENTTGENPAAGGTGKPIADLGPSSFGGTMTGGVITSANGNPPAPGTNGMSVAEVAAKYRTANAGLNARTLTNQDVDQMLSSKAGVTVAKNMPPLGPSAMPSGLTQGGAPQSTAPTAGQQPVTPPPAEATQAQPSGAAGTTAGATTTPQINPSQQSNDAQGKSKLPSTATFLPLLGLLGLISGGIGLLVRKFRR